MIVTGTTKQRTYNTKTCSRHGDHYRIFDYRVPRNDDRRFKRVKQTKLNEERRKGKKGKGIFTNFTACCVVILRKSSSVVGGYILGNFLKFSFVSRT